METCSAPNCINPAVYKTLLLCKTHYGYRRLQGVTDEICNTPGCGRKILNKKRKLCGRCYHYWLQTDAPHKPRCSIEDCDRPAWSQGFCSTHYKRGKRAGGHPSLAPGRGSPGKARGIRSMKGEYIQNGYKKIRVQREQGQKYEWMLEHRYVMEQHLGRSLYPDENIHHKDGNRSNNDISNLELWVERQPQGQRVEELVAWAKEIIRRYG